MQVTLYLTLVAGAIAYIVTPMDFIPDFLPFIGQVDDLYLLALALDRLLNNAGIDVLLEHWDGDVGSLETAITALESTQNDVGGWAFDGSTDALAADSNTTSMVIQALVTMAFTVLPGVLVSYRETGVLRRLSTTITRYLSPAQET